MFLSYALHIPVKRFPVPLSVVANEFQQVIELLIAFCMPLHSAHSVPR